MWLKPFFHWDVNFPALKLRSQARQARQALLKNLTQHLVFVPVLMFRNLTAKELQGHLFSSVWIGDALFSICSVFVKSSYTVTIRLLLEKHFDLDLEKVFKQGPVQHDVLKSLKSS